MYDENTGFFQKCLRFIVFPFWKQQETSLVIILSFRKHTHTHTKHWEWETDLLKRLFKNNFFPPTRARLQKTGKIYSTEDVFSAVNSWCNVFHVRKFPAELQQQMGWNHHMGKRSYTPTEERAAPALAFSWSLRLSKQPSR